MIFEIYAYIIEGEEYWPGCNVFNNIPVRFLRMSGRAHMQKLVWQFSFALHHRFYWLSGEITLNNNNNENIQVLETGWEQQHAC